MTMMIVIITLVMLMSGDDSGNDNEFEHKNGDNSYANLQQYLG